ncbi:hypothetical protein ABZ137_21115 [Streptomyces bobili]|uniref:alpha/beta fold hydrolase n=1 Tax=Streptomyces bobili TaxID=67280 RepID=UPI0033BB4F3D
MSLPPAILLGQSLGGLTARPTAAAHPSRVASLILVKAKPAGRTPDLPTRIAHWLDGPLPVPSRGDGVPGPRQGGRRPGPATGRRPRPSAPGHDDRGGGGTLHGGILGRVVPDGVRSATSSPTARASPRGVAERKPAVMLFPDDVQAGRLSTESGEAPSAGLTPRRSARRSRPSIPRHRQRRSVPPCQR